MREIGSLHVTLVNIMMTLGGITVCPNVRCTTCPYVEQKDELFIVQFDDGINACLVHRGGYVAFEGYCTRNITAH